MHATQWEKTCEVLADRWLNDIDKCGLLTRRADRERHAKGACFGAAILDAFVKGAAVGQLNTDSAAGLD